MNIIERIKLKFSKIDKAKSIVFVFPIIFILLVTIIAVNAVTTTVKEVEITSNYSGEGSWTINKSATWIKENKARITFELGSQMKTDTNNKDIILVIDVSGSMNGSKLDRVKEDSKDLINTLLTDSNNSIGVITFEDTSHKLSDLTNDANALSTIIDNLSTSGCTNYDAGLKEAKKIIDNYTKVNNKDLVVLFLTDGYPNVDTPNQVSTYEIIKEEYPYAEINAIQYEMGKDIIEDIVNISDNQFIASEDTLNNVLFEASVSPQLYDNFKIEDYISNYFEVESISSIKSSIGTVNITTSSGLQKVTWDLGNNYKTGKTETLTIDVNLKTDYQNIDDTFNTNDHEVITSKLPEDTERVVNSSLTPVLASNYTVIYDTNTPDGCTLPNISNESHKVFSTVTIRNEKLSCNGYLFKGYEIEDEDITKINDDTFIMPGHDVTIRAVWGKVSLSKSMDGTVSEGLTLYKTIKNEYKSNSGYAGLYTGEHQDSITREATKDIYYYKTPTTDNTTEGNNLLDKINVLFAGYCWQMLRTTDTGGVKMIYNGVPVDGKCTNTRTNVNGLIQGDRTTNNMNASYTYGSDFTYDIDAKTFKIDGTIKENINYSSDKSVIGYYTCKNIDKNATCTTLYYLQEESTTNTSPYVYPFTINITNYAQIGTTPFNSQYDSPAYVGYMYNKAYDSKTYPETITQNYTTSSTQLSYTSLNTTYYYADSINFGTTNYELVNPYKVTSTDDYPSLVGKYTFRNASETYTYSSVYYIVGVSGTTMYYRGFGSNNINPTVYYYGDAYDYGETTSGKYTITNATRWSSGVDVTGKYVTNGVNNTAIYYVIGMNGSRIFYEPISNGDKLFYNGSITFGDSITDNGDDTYTINNPITGVTLSDYFANYASYKNKYTCGDDSTICKQPRYITATNSISYTYINASDKILISKTRNGLELTDTLVVNLDELSINRANYSDYKYTCNTTSSTCTEDTLRMITEFTETGYKYAKNIYLGESVTWTGSKYILSNVVGVESATNLTDISTHHYFCAGIGLKECTSVGYIFNYSGSGTMRYILLESGAETVEEALNKMLCDNNVNTKDSSIKRLVEEWYYNNLLDYDSYLEETIYCNDRSIRDIGGWKADGGMTNNNLRFKESNLTSDLSCSNETDQFSVLNNKAKLKYKVGLASSPEMRLLNNVAARKTGATYWLGSPENFEAYGDKVRFVSSDGVLNLNYGYSRYWARPVVSIGAGTVPVSGDGSMNSPYVVDTTVNP